VFDAHLGRWEAAEADPDGTLERVARAIAESEDAHTAFGFPCRCGWMAEFGRGWEERVDRHRLAAKAAAAIEALRPAPDAPRVESPRSTDLRAYCYQCHHAWTAHDDGTDDGDYCRVCECDGYVPDVDAAS
jgi:hypothetical protein